MNSLFLVFMERVAVGSFEHILPIVFALTFAAILYKYASSLDKEKQYKIIHYFGCLVSLTVVVFHVNLILQGGYDLSENLPLYLCSFLALTIPLLTYYRFYWMFEILLFWIIAGTTQGVLTPDIADGFPAFDYFRYWVVHLGILIVIFYFVFVLKMRPRLKSVFKSFLALHPYMLLVLGINYVLGSNYSYLNRKPESASVLDYLGDWPYYILVIEAILIPYFLLIYLPFYLTRKTSI